MNLINIYWFEQTIADVPANDSWLTARERDYLRTLRVPKRHEDWLLGRWTAKNAAAVFLGISVESRSLQDIEVKPRLSGAPKLFFKNEPAPVSLSLTHRSSHAACALAQCHVALGCDIETVEPHSDAFASDYFAPEEQALVMNTAPPDRLWILSLLWSAKESALKVLEEGLRLDTREVIVKFPGCSYSPRHKRADSLCRGPGWSPLQVRRTNNQMFYGWWSHSGDLLRTVMANIPSGPPIRLPQPSISPPSLACSRSGK